MPEMPVSNLLSSLQSVGRVFIGVALCLGLIGAMTGKGRNSFPILVGGFCMLLMATVMVNFVLNTSVVDSATPSSGASQSSSAASVDTDHIPTSGGGGSGTVTSSASTNGNGTLAAPLSRPVVTPSHDTYNDVKPAPVEEPSVTGEIFLFGFVFLAELCAISYGGYRFLDWRQRRRLALEQERLEILNEQIQDANRLLRRVRQ